MEYVDFEIDVQHGAEDTYDVSVVQSPAGEARAQMRFPYDRLVLQNKLQALQIVLLGARGVRRGVTEDDTVRDLGSDLYGALFCGDVANRLEVTQSLAKSQGKGVRIKLRIGAPELLGLPWEYLYDTALGDYLALAVSTPVVRYISIPQSIEPLAVSPPLRILAMTAGPKDLASLDVQRERQRLDVALNTLREHGLVELHWVEGESWESLQQELWNGPWHVFHFVGHGGFNERKGTGVIYLTGEDGNARELSAIDFARLLGDHEPLRLAVLNSCETAQGTATDVFSSTAASLVRKGTPAVVAMQFQITDDAAIQFSKVFYAAAAHGMPIDSAVAEARKAVALQLGSYEWGTPVLFMRSPDGVLFKVPPKVGAAAAVEVAKSVESPPPTLEPADAASAPIIAAAVADALPPPAPTPSVLPDAASAAVIAAAVAAAEPAATPEPAAAPAPAESTRSGAAAPATPTTVEPATTPPASAAPSLEPPAPVVEPAHEAPPERSAALSAPIFASVPQAANSSPPPPAPQSTNGPEPPAWFPTGYPAQQTAAAMPPAYGANIAPYPAGAGYRPWADAQSAPRKSRTKLWFIGGGLIAGVLGLGVVFATLSAPAPYLTIYPTEGAPGTSMNVYGSNFAPLTRVLLGWNDGAQQALYANSSGYFSASLSVPADAAEGSLVEFTLNDEAGRVFNQNFLVTTSDDFTVTPAPRVTPAPQITDAAPADEPPDQSVVAALCAAESTASQLSDHRTALETAITADDFAEAQLEHDSIQSLVSTLDDYLDTARDWGPLASTVDDLRSRLSDWSAAVDDYFNSPSSSTLQALSRSDDAANKGLAALGSFQDAHPEIGQSCW